MLTCIDVKFIDSVRLGLSSSANILQIADHLPLIAHKRTVMSHYKNSGLRLSFSTIMFMRIHKFFKRMISCSNFVAIARLVIDASDTDAIDVE